MMLASLAVAAQQWAQRVLAEVGLKHGVITTSDALVTPHNEAARLSIITREFCQCWSIASRTRHRF